MLKIGVTGGIGSGKSSVCEEFQKLGIPVYNSDVRAKYLMTNNSDLRQAIIDQFGHESYTHDGALDRNFLASIVGHLGQLTSKSG